VKRAAANYVPDRGDLVWVTLNPIAGHEQAGRRPALVISPRRYNRKTRLCVLCPATRQAKGYAFEVEIANPDGSTSVVLADHLRSVDCKARKMQLMHRVTDAELADVIARIDALIVSPDT